jgi:methylthioribose-1-phosphate isomerase
MKQQWDCQNVRFSESGDAVDIIDQSLLPGETVYLTLQTKEELFEAIRNLRVRGAPAIGIFGAFAFSVLAGQSKATDYQDFCREMQSFASYLDSSRPTASNLGRMLRRMLQLVLSGRDRYPDALLEDLHREALCIQREDIEMCRAISEFGLELIRDGDGVLTHCNAGPLATSQYGTGLGPLFLGKERGMAFHVYCDETRPLLQGARLTSFELSAAGIDCTLICDNMAAQVMKEGKIQACFVGCDRVAKNGDAANKIGTFGAAVLARYFDIPFYVFCPSSTIDLHCETARTSSSSSARRKRSKNCFSASRRHLKRSPATTRPSTSRRTI